MWFATVVKARRALRWCHLLRQTRYFDDSDMPRPFAISSIPEMGLQQGIIRAIGSVTHSCGHAPLPAIGLLLRTLVYHDSSACVPGLPLDDSEFLTTLVEVRGGRPHRHVVCSYVRRCAALRQTRLCRPLA